MASSIGNSDSFVITGMEMVPYVPPESEGDEGFHTPKNQSPIIIPLVKVTEEERKTPSKSRLSLFERLEGWTIEKRQRDNKRFDKYYYHGMSNRMFRSFAEVVRFIIYGLYPQKPQHLNNKEPHEALWVNGPESLQRTSLKRKRATQTVEEMLEKAYENMQNSYNIQKEIVCSSLDDKEVEGFLRKANENLLKLFDKEVDEAQGNIEKSKKEGKKADDISTANPSPNYVPLNSREEPMIHDAPHIEKSKKEEREVEGMSTINPSPNFSPINSSEEVIPYFDAFEDYILSDEEHGA
ncbi:hypothetical protein F0562_016320 [Nyssa sinensis]|uniref:MBD domain-containing protein n=1 Tax=Nyssa sinensis TaxID=561372 RepID=A0A5J4ZMJ3_9ASTE|nr:hypothetical protein F0562_016320 [Nyssa sinensis]